KAADRGDDARYETDREQPLLEAAQRLRQRQSRYPFEQAGLAGQRKVQDPRADCEGERDDRGRRRAVGNGRREQRDGADQQAVEQVTENEIGGFRGGEMPAEHGPDRERRDRRNGRDQQREQDRRHLGGDQRRNPIGQLHQEPERAGFLLTA